MRDDLKRCSIAAFYRDYSDGWKFITLIGIHAGNDNVLYVDSDGKTHQESGRSQRIYRVLTQAEIAECRKIEDRIKVEEKKLAAWLKKRSLNAVAEVRKAIGLPAVKVDAPDDEDFN